MRYLLGVIPQPTLRTRVNKWIMRMARELYLSRTKFP